MTSKQKIFVKEYIISKNATEAYIKAGFSSKYAAENAGKLLKNTSVKEAIDQEFKRIMDQYEFTERDVYKGLGEIARNGQQESNKVRAWELIGKALSMFKDNTVNVAILGNIDQDKLAKARKALKARGL